MEEKKNKFEMLSAYVDGELNEAESAEILEMLRSDSELRQRLQKYSLLSGLINLDRSNKAEPSNGPLARIFSMPKSYVTGMAATILIALIVVSNNYTFDQTNNEIIANAVSSQEAQYHLNNIDGALNQHVMKILASRSFEASALSDGSKLINPEMDEYFCSLCLSSESDCSISRI